jgi:hypothetical protein
VGLTSFAELAPWLCPNPSRPLGQAPDVAVAQAVVDEQEKLAGRGDAADVAAPPAGDPLVGGRDGVAAVVAGDGFDGSSVGSAAAV